MTSTSEATPRSVPSKDGTNDNGVTDGRSGRLLALVLATQFMALLDTFIVNVAAPTIRTELGASGAGLQLVVAGYTITYAVLLITDARLGGCSATAVPIWPGSRSSPPPHSPADWPRTPHS